MEKRAITPPTNALLPNAGFEPEKLLAPRQALVAFFSRVAFPALVAERVALDAALGRVLAADLDADDDYPNAARSAMDGFAVDAACAPGTLRLVGEVRMGAPSQTGIARGEAMRIPTGGVLPPGADAVIPIEDARVAGDRVHIAQNVEAGANVIARGSDMRRGERVLARGRRIAPPQIGVLATLGVTQVPVFRRPLIAVISTGDELVDPARVPEPGCVRDSNRYAVAAALRAMGADARHEPTAGDEPDELRAALARALARSDGIVVTGGSSVGERDRLPPAVAALGEPGVVVHGLRVRPGKPTLLGAAGSKPIVGLPGNPASALMMLEAVGAPVIAALCGAPAPERTLAAVLGADLLGRAGWTWYVPVALKHDGGTVLAHPLPLRSFSVSLAARADGYVVMEERDAGMPAGTAVVVHRFSGG